jgi:ATP-dependent DNA helicase RecG
MGALSMTTENNAKKAREYMDLAVTMMKKSISEGRTDKNSPLVGAVIVMPDGHIEKACRGEFSEGDHAEYTLLERKLSSENLTGATLFATLEPCAPGARSTAKISCAERIVNRRISKVWIGIEDPDPLVDSKGIRYLEEHGVAVELFDRDLQEAIRYANADFIKGAEERANRYDENASTHTLSDLEKPILTASLDDLNASEIETLIDMTSEFRFKYGSDEFFRFFTQLKYLAKVDNNIYPTGLGMLLFGENPQIFFPNAVIRATMRTTDGTEDIVTFAGSIPKQSRESHEWFKKVIGKHIDRSSAQRENIFKYPTNVVRESINNALAHRSYDIDGASIHLEICEDTIVIRSPGSPVKPISMERMKKLDAPYLSKNPKITYVFEKLGLSESRGLGFTTIRSLPDVYKLPLPVVSFDDPYLIFAFSRAYSNGNGISEQNHPLTKSEARGYDYVRLNSPFTRKAYEEYLEVSEKTAGRHIARFIELGLVKSVGSGVKISYEII